MRVGLFLAILFALPAPAAAAKSSARKAPVAHAPKQVRPAAARKVAAAKKPACKPAAPAPAVAFSNEAAKPADDDPNRERIARLQDTLEEVVRGKILGRLRVGMQVEDLATKRVLFGWRSSRLMDPASNQKVLATTAALLRLGSEFRYRTEVTGPGPDAHGTVAGDIVLHSSGDPSLRERHIEALATELAAKGITRVTGAVLGDSNRLGSDEQMVGGRPPLRVGAAPIEILVRPADKVGSRPVVSLRPASDALVVVNQAETLAKGKGRLGVSMVWVGRRIHVVVTGKIARTRGLVAIRRSPPNHSLFAALLLRQALAQAGVVVEGGVGVSSGLDRSRVASEPTVDGLALALAAPAGDSPTPLLARAHRRPAELLAVHQSDPLPVLLRRINKASDNEWAERVLETVGAEIYGGAATNAKGVRALREALADLDLPLTNYLPSNGSGLGHQNRVSASGMIALLRRLYFDPRIGPELMQSLSVGGVDGTTRNRFRGTTAAHRVRAKTGTLNGVSCLSGFVGDGPDILAFSILVEGHPRRGVRSVRAEQVNAVNAMMRFAKGMTGSTPDEGAESETDYETGEETDDAEAIDVEQAPAQ
jgi:serine-type D-Ala-D-Ala carboxypeptidase/endopeptidase (penicillin-binding protein 4)